MSKTTMWSRRVQRERGTGFPLFTSESKTRIGCCTPPEILGYLRAYLLEFREVCWESIKLKIWKGCVFLKVRIWVRFMFKDYASYFL